MAQYLLGVNFSGPANSGETVSASWTGAGGTVVTNITTFVPTRLTTQQTTIGTDALSQAINFYDSTSTDYIGNFYVDRVGTTVYISSRNTTNPMSGLTTASNVTFTESAVGFISNVDETNGCVYFTLNAPYTASTSGVAIETSTDNGATWSYSPGTNVSPRCSSVPVSQPTLYRLRGLNSFSGSTSDIYELTPSFNQTIQDIRARSPYLLISTTSGITFNSSVFTIRQFNGSIFDYASAPISYNKTKQKLINGQDNIWINLSGLLKEDLEADVDYYQDADYTTARNLSDNESKWVYVNTVNQYNSSGVTTGDTFYFVTDGYIEPTDGSHDLPNVLKTGNKRYIYRNSNERIYFKTDNLTGATYSTPTVGPISISFTGDTDESFGYVKSVKVDNTNIDNEITYTFGYSGQSAQTITYEFYDECLYSNYDLVFKNKYGMLETLSMSKKSSKTLNIESTDYLRSIVNLEGVYNINRHTNKQFNVGGMEEWTLNTEMLPEYMNSVVKEAYLSEEMWLIDSAGVITPVIRKDQNVQFRTILNREMVQYTLVVTLSHNTVQNIQ